MSQLLKSIKEPHNLVFLFAIAVYAVTAVNSHGFYHADEHYQIIDFAGTKLGTHQPSDLAWEYNAQIRPAIQPTIAFLTIKLLNAAGISNPYHLVLVLRLFTALLALLAIRFFVCNTEHLFPIKKHRIAYYFASYLLFFMPYLNVRFSSEAWSGIFLLLSVSVYINSKVNPSKTLLVGLLMGLSFLFRYQIAFALLGFGAYIILIDHVKLKTIMALLIGFFSMMLAGFIIDAWFYGVFVSTPWNLLLSVIESGGNGFGTSPWYFYITSLLSYPTYVIGIPLFAGLIWLIFASPKRIYTWLIVPFFILHSIIPHKEERFIFPMIYYFPIVLALVYQLIDTTLKRRFWRFFWHIYISLFIVINLIGMVALSQKSAGIGRMTISKYIHDNYGNKPINIIHCSYANPYNPWHSVPAKFYLEKNSTSYRLENLCDLNDSLLKPDAINLFLSRKYEIEHSNCQNIIANNGFKIEIQSIPVWVEKLNAIYKGFHNYDIIELYVYDPNNVKAN